MVVVVEQRVRDTGDHEGLAVVGGHRTPAVLATDEYFESLDRQVAPVGVVRTLEWRSLVVLLGFHRLGDERVAPVGADDDRGLLGDGCTARVVSADAGDASVVVGDDCLDDELLSHLGTGAGGGVDEDLVEHGAARAERLGHAVERLR